VQVYSLYSDVFTGMMQLKF